MADPERRLTWVGLVGLALLLVIAGVGAIINHYDLTRPWRYNDTEQAIDVALVSAAAIHEYILLKSRPMTTTSIPNSAFTTPTTRPYLELRLAEADFADDMASRAGLSRAERQTEENQEWLAEGVDVAWRICETLDDNPAERTSSLREWISSRDDKVYITRFIASAIEHLCPQHNDLLGQP